MNRPKRIATEEQLLNELHNRDWGELWVKLQVRCIWLLRNRYTVEWSKNEVKEFSRRMISEIAEIIFIEKRRKWNLNYYSDFENFIIGALDSHVNNAFHKRSKEFGVKFEEGSLNKKSIRETNTLDNIISSDLRNIIFTALEAAGAEDDELLIFECLADGIEKPGDIKKELGLNDDEFHNAWRRFKRKRNIVKQNLVAHGY